MKKAIKIENGQIDTNNDTKSVSSVNNDSAIKIDTKPSSTLQSLSNNWGVIDFELDW